MFSSEAGLNQHFGRGRSTYLKGVVGGFALAALMGGERERGAGAPQNPYHLLLRNGA